MGSAVQSSPLTSTLTMRAFLTVFLAVAVCGEADPYTIGQVLAGRTAGGVITGVSYPGVGTVAGFPYTAVPHIGYSHPVVYGKREAEAEPEPYTVGQIAAGHHIANAVAEGRAHNVGVITNAAIAPVVHHGVVGYAGYHPYVYGKREAEAEPYYGYTAGVYPSVYHAGIHHGVVGYAGYHPYVYGKREAEAEPFYGYAAGVVPYVHHAGIVAPTGLGHAVAVTGYGHVTHSSNVGVCTNVAGVQVPC